MESLEDITKQKVEVREAIQEDWPCYHQIINSLSFQKFTVGRKIRYIHELEAEKKWKAKIADPDCYTLVAEVEASKKIVGYVRLRRLKGIYSHVGEIAALAVLEEFQRRGIGTLLMKSLVSFAISKLGLKRLQLTVHTDNNVARRVYKKVGFKLEGRRMLALYREDEKAYVSLTLMGMLAEPILP